MLCGGPLLHYVELALSAARSSRPFKATVKVCLGRLRSEAQRGHDGYIGLSAAMLSDALRSPESDRRGDVLDALIMCRRAILAEASKAAHAR